jgi:hypothetical protein
MTQVIVIVEVLIAGRMTKDPLCNKGRHIMLDQVSAAIIRKAPGKPVDQSDPALGCPRKQPACIRGDRASVKRGHNLALFHSGKALQIAGRLCLHRETPFALRFDFVAKRNSQSSSPDAPPVFVTSGLAAGFTGAAF